MGLVGALVISTGGGVDLVKFTRRPLAGAPTRTIADMID